MCDMNIMPSFIQANYPILTFDPPSGVFNSMNICVKLMDSRTAFRKYTLPLNIAPDFSNQDVPYFDGLSQFDDKTLQVGDTLKIILPSIRNDD